jgi:hypothetical protein
MKKEGVMTREDLEPFVEKGRRAVMTREELGLEDLLTSEELETFPEYLVNEGICEQLATGEYRFTQRYLDEVQELLSALVLAEDGHVH